MKLWSILAVSMGLVGSAGLASADPWKDESGKGRERGGYARYDDGSYGYGREPRRERRAFKEEYDDGRCKVERKLEKNGDYKEERKCRSPQHVYAPAPVYVVPQPVVVAPHPVVVAPQPVYVPAPVEPSVTIRATIPLK